MRPKQVSASGWLATDRRNRRQRNSIRAFAVSLKDINQALKKKVAVDLRPLLPEYLKDQWEVFSKEQADRLPPL